MFMNYAGDPPCSVQHVISTASASHALSGRRVNDILVIENNYQEEPVKGGYRMDYISPSFHVVELSFKTVGFI